MNKEIVINETFEEVSFDVVISYLIESGDGIQTITCKIETKGCYLPMWLGTRAFNFKSSMHNGTYTQLHNHLPDRNLNMLLFMDKVYMSIMETERLKTQL